MTPDDTLRHERFAALDRWEDSYTARLDEALRGGLPDLRERLRDAVAKLSFWDLSLGPGDRFRKRLLDPAINAWVDRHVGPVVDDARRDLARVVHGGDLPDGRGSSLTGPAGGLGVTDVLGALALPAGLLVGGGAAVASIGTATSWLLWPVLVVNWPVLVAGLAAGGVLSAVGVVSLANLHLTLTRRLEGQLFPQVCEAIVGSGVAEGKTRHPSLLAQLQSQIRQAAQAARASLKEGGPS